MIPEPAATVIGRFVARLDRALPGVIGGFYDAGWHPVIRDALAYWRCLPPVPNRSSRALRTETAAFVSHVVGLVGAR